jgi:hypothetical protein
MFEQALKKKQTTTRLMYLCGPMVGYPKFTCEPNDSHKLPLICNQRDSRQFHRVMDQLDADTIAASWSMREWNEKNSSTQFRDLDDERGRLAMRNHEARRADHPGESPSRGYRRRPLHWRRNTAQVELAVTAASPSSPATCASRKASERLLWITLAVPSKRPTPSDLRLRFFHHVSLVAVMVGRGSEADHWAWGRLVSGHLSAAGLQAADLFY